MRLTGNQKSAIVVTAMKNSTAEVSQVSLIQAPNDRFRTVGREVRRSASAGGIIVAVVSFMGELCRRAALRTANCSFLFKEKKAVVRPSLLHPHRRVFQEIV